jgi:hypothetical protein
MLWLLITKTTFAGQHGEHKQYGRHQQHGNWQVNENLKDVYFPKLLLPV